MVALFTVRIDDVRSQLAFDSGAQLSCNPLFPKRYVLFHLRGSSLARSQRSLVILRIRTSTP